MRPTAALLSLNRHASREHPALAWGMENFAECAVIASLVNAAAPKPGAFGLLVTEPLSSPAFPDLPPRTKADYQRILDRLAALASVSLTRFDHPYGFGSGTTP